MKFDIVIVGGGLAGLSLAAMLDRSDLTVAVVESRAPSRTEGWDARIYAVSPSNQAFLERADIWRDFDPARLAQITSMEIVGDGQGRVDFSAYDAGIGELAWIVEASVMQCALWERLTRNSDIRLFCPVRPETLDMRGETARLTMDDGSTLEADLLIGADGVDSWVRREAGIDARFRDYDQLGVVANFECAQPHYGTACQWFRRDGILAYLPMPGNRISIVWSTSRAHAGELLGLRAEALADRVAQAGTSRFGELRLMAPAQAFPLRWMRAGQVCAPHLALVGDAAHAVHPLSGHGINLGFRDAETLGRLLRDKPRHVRSGSLGLLRRYERARREEVVLVQSLTDALQRMFVAEGKVVSTLRNFGMNLTNATPVIKDLLIRYAVAS